MHSGTSRVTYKFVCECGGTRVMHVVIGWCNRVGVAAGMPPSWTQSHHLSGSQRKALAMMPNGRCVLLNWWQVSADQNPEPRTLSCLF